MLTLKGNSFASRVAASLLNTIKLNELITTNIEDYKKLAIKIYSEKVYLDENGIQLLFDLLNYRETQKMTSILSSQESINALSNIERTIDLND